jgi:hypothetical protein
VAEMIDKVLFEYIRSFVLAAPIHYGSAEGESLPHYVMAKIIDPERPEVLCFDQGESGQALFMFDGYAGGQGSAYTAATTEAFVEQLKVLVSSVRGEIGTIEKYRIWSNETRGVTLVGQQDMFTWQAQFELVIHWERI